MKEQENIGKYTNKKWCVYRHKSPSGKVYIGITSLKPSRRWGKNGKNYRDNYYFKHAINKYGWDNFTHEVLFENLSENKAKELEINLIRHYKNLKICYNLSAGGDGNSKKVSEETKLKISKALKGRKSYYRDKVWRQQRSELMKQHPVLTKESIEKAHINSAKKLSKKVIQFDLNNKKIREYNSIREASRETGFDYSYIAKCCKGKYLSVYNFKWKYK